MKRFIVFVSVLTLLSAAIVTHKFLNRSYPASDLLIRNVQALAQNESLQKWVLKPTNTDCTITGPYGDKLQGKWYNCEASSTGGELSCLGGCITN